MAARRSRRNGRFTKSSSRRRRKPKTNLTNIAISAAVANGVTQGLFNTNLVEFMTGRVNGVYKPGGDGSSVITLPELLGAGPGGIGGNFAGTAGRYDNLSNSLMSNFKTNFFPMAVAVIGIPVAAKVATKVLRKPVLTPANKLIKMTGLDVKL